MDGVLVIDKPAGPTSADIVRKVKRATRAKVGHLGTLDPFATGVLPICLGQGTKVAQFLSIADKEYEGTIRLGFATDTGDCTGRALAEPQPVPSITDEQLSGVAQSFLGDRMQTPPMYSAIKRDGQPLYKLARAGIEVEREPRPIRIAAFELSLAAPDRLAFRVACTKGTYVRVLAEEVAAALGTTGHLDSLRRTRFGEFAIADAVGLEALEETADLPVLDVRRAMSSVPEIVLNRYQSDRVRHGDPTILSRLPLPEDGPPTKLVGDDGSLLAVVQRNDASEWRYARVFE